jgi:hypothetical protein
MKEEGGRMKGVFEGKSKKEAAFAESYGEPGN